MLLKTDKPPPNSTLQPTPLRVHKIGAFLKASFCSNVVAICQWRRG